MSIKDKITGRVKKAAGDLADDPSLRQPIDREAEAERQRGDGRKRVGALDRVAIARRIRHSQVEDRSERGDRP